MNKKKLKESQNTFYERFPGGFSNPEMVRIKKKHKPEKMYQLANDSFSKDKFGNLLEVFDSFRNIIAKSSMVSVFEKVKFRDFAKMVSDDDKKEIAKGLKEFFYGDESKGFEKLVEILAKDKLAKWPIITACFVYMRPSVEVFVKPTTAKGVIKYYEIENLVYKPRPTYEFYKNYRNLIKDMKKEVDDELTNDNAAFSGFLMMSMKE